MRNPRVAPSNNQKNFLMIGGVVLVGAIIWWYMKKLTEDQISQKYAMDTWGISSELADQVVEKANYINSQPESDWYIDSVRRAGEKGRDVPTQLLHEAWWVINAPTRKLEYAQSTWGLDSDQAKEILEYSESKILTDTKWHEDTKERAKERGRDVWQQLLHEAHWQLYAKDGAKYKTD